MRTLTVEESLDDSWAGDQYLFSDNWTGWWYFDTSSVYMYRSDATPNEGVGWSFVEWKPHMQASRTSLRIRVLYGSVVTLLMALVLGCDLGSGATRIPADQLGIDPRSVVTLSDSGIAARIVTDNVQVVVVSREGTEWVTSTITSSKAAPGTNSVHLLSYGGNTGHEWNTLVYGTAQANVAHVTLGGFDQPTGGDVVDGAWLVVLREKDVVPDQLLTTFIAADGTIIESGTGIFPPDA